MCSSPTYVYSREVNLKIQVVDEDGKTLQKAKIGIDRDTTTFDKLKNHLIKTLKLKSKFLLKYQMRKCKGETILTDDWDLDVALQQCRHSLKMLVQTYSQDSTKENNGSLVALDGGDLSQKPSAGGATSMLDRLMDKMEDWFSFNGSQDSMMSRSKAPMTFREFQNYLDEEGRLVNYQGFRESIYLGGIAPAMRKIAWRHLLCVFPEGLTADERIEYLKEKSEEYTSMRDKWKRDYKRNNEEIPEQMRFVTTMVKKDVVRTDRTTPYYKGREDNKHTMSLFDLLCTYALNHPNVSYCQGMCDLASPLLAIQDNEAHAYILFCSLMQRMKYNFSFDSIAISVKFAHLTQLLLHFDPEFYSYLQEHQVENLLFAYRWLLLEMKREFAFEDSCYFTEVMWSSLPTLPSSEGVPLFQASDLTEANGSNNTLSPFERINNRDSDTESFATTSSALTDFPDCGNMSGDHSLIGKQECIERGLMEDGDSDAVFSIASESEYGCECTNDNEHMLKEFYEELENSGTVDQCDYANQVRRPSIDSAAAEDFSGLTSLCGPRQGSDSVDSGFGSRPGSPTRTDSAAPSTSEPVLPEESSHLFPPPKEFGYGNPFLMFASLAMILEQRDLIMGNKLDFNDIVMLFSGYKSHNNVTTIVKESKQLYEAYIMGELEPDEDEFEHLDASFASDHTE